MTLPAHRFEDRKKGKGDGPQVFTFDFDETITTAPAFMATIAAGLLALGHTVYVITGNQSPRDDLIKRLNDYGFPFDELIQYQDDGTDGLRRAAYMKELNAAGAFDNRADRGYTYAKVCPHLFLIAKPNKAEKQNDKGAKSDAKKDTKGL